MNPSVWTAIIGFVAAIMGGAVQAAFTAARERRAFRFALNRDNYVIFLRTVAGIAKNPTNGSERTKYTQMSIEAIGRIMLQGSSDVVAALRADVGGKPIQTFESEVRTILFEDNK